MKKLKFFILLVACMIASSAQAGGLVGSGAGYHEMNFQYVYVNLASWLTNCMAVPLEEGGCESQGYNGELLTKITEILKANRARTDILKFASEQSEPALFKTGIHEPDRIAKSMFENDNTILVNVDELYKQDNSRPNLDIPAIASVLLHEIGHQAGEPDHRRLDHLGSQIRNFLNRVTTLYPFEIGPEYEKLNLTVVNQRGSVQVSMMNFFWENKYSTDVTSKVFRQLRCSKPGFKLGGYSVYNAAFATIGRSLDKVNFNFRVRMLCSSKEHQQAVEERLQLQLTFAADQNVELKTQRLAP
jgi:hypothetical protein